VINKVHIEFQRVQTWLFAVPRLRAMVGANTLLGEALREDLRQLSRKSGTWSLQPGSGNYPAADPDDPLKDHDNPAADAKEGILSRDGGHFEAAFSAGAEAFAEEAAALLHRKVPGLRFRILVDGIERTQASTEMSSELPVFEPCEWTGRGQASCTVAQGREYAEVALEVARRHKAAQLAEDGKASDLASMLTRQTKLANFQRHSDLDELAGNGYLAVIHADGNGVGREEPNEAKRAAFYHRNRVLLRRALQFAINHACEHATALPPAGRHHDLTTAPLVLLMLGGDDVLVVSRAAPALSFVADLCRELERLQSNRGNLFHLTLGVGIVFSKPTVPIYRLHELAEQLADSSKRRFRGFAEHERGSVADWAVYTTAWVDAPAEIRRRDWVRGSGENRRILSLRPLRILGDGLASVDGLLKAKDLIMDAPRSQLRYLLDQLHRGKALSELAFAELSKEARDAFVQAGVSEVWTRGSDTEPYSTSVLDLMEVFEIERLGRADSGQASGGIV
jgi:hypothetical protein